MSNAPDPAEIARVLALAEEGLRRNGFTERTIKRLRKSTRAAITAALTEKEQG
ncbi:hypothetical protein [Brevundimonas subvibrioides]|uniref:hypothetical protein n=1 Tax=Brevundimonas subvibrioides TaxID=74313 RepID=UPI0022B3E2E1|nr:hypothetical protein [Brevundimonas subvibrioides]